MAITSPPTAAKSGRTKATSEKVDRLFRFEIAPIQRVKAFWRFSEMSKRFKRSAPAQNAKRPGNLPGRFRFLR
jgi:hypothetical protein